MPTGTVKWFNNAKGYGFILPDEGGEDLFVHYTSILMDGYKTLKAGQNVVFEVVKGGKGLHATNIRTADSPEAHSRVESAVEPASKGGANEDNQQATGEEKREAASGNNSEIEAYS